MAWPSSHRRLDRIKDVIQNLFEIQSAVHGYLGHETQQQLIRKMYETLLNMPDPIFTKLYLE